MNRADQEQLARQRERETAEQGVVEINGYSLMTHASVQKHSLTPQAQSHLYIVKDKQVAAVHSLDQLIDVEHNPEKVEEHFRLLDREANDKEKQSAGAVPALKLGTHMNHDFAVGLCLGSGPGRIEAMIQEFGRDKIIHATTQYGDTLLHVACDLKSATAVEICLAHGADPNATDREGKTPLQRVGFDQHPRWSLAEQLVEAGADIEVRDKIGQTTLQLRAGHDDSNGVARLIALGADVDAQSSAGNTALHFSLQSPAVATTLIAAGALIDAENHNRCQPIHFIARDGSAETLKVLLEAGADPNCRDDNGETPMMYAVENNNWSVKDRISLLINAGANPLHKNNEGQSAIEYARTKGVAIHDPNAVQNILADHAASNSKISRPRLRKS